MKFSLWTQYGALNSTPVFDAFRQGVRALGFTCVNDSEDADVDVIWSILFNGRMSGNKAIWENAQRTSKPVIVLEVGGIQRGKTWKVGLNGINRDAYFGPGNNNNDRNHLLGLSLKPWRTNGKYILICGQHNKSLQWNNMLPISSWVMDTIETLQAHYNYPIIFRPHPRCRLDSIEHQYKNVYRQDPVKINGTYDDYDMNFDNIKFTINWSSNPGIHSIIQGVPAFVGPSSLAWDVASQDLLRVDNPRMPDRQQWLNDYAHTEWTVEEISQGIPLNLLTNKL